MYTGQVLIDGEDVAKIERRSLRRRVGLVPQNPVIFKASIRDNVAPIIPEDAEASAAVHYDDQQIMRMLSAFHLGEKVAEKGGIDAQVRTCH